MEILSPIVETLSADVEMLSPIGAILSLIWAELGGILLEVSPKIGDSISYLEILSPIFWRIPHTVS